MSVDPASAVGGLLVGALFTIALTYPRIARAIGKIASVVLLGIGACLLTLGLYYAISGEELPRLSAGPVILSRVGQTLAWAGGCLAAGITALVLAFVGRIR